MVSKDRVASWVSSYVICHFVLRLDAFGAEEVLEWLLLLTVVMS